MVAPPWVELTETWPETIRRLTTPLHLSLLPHRLYGMGGFVILPDVQRGVNPFPAYIEVLDF